MKRLLMIAIVTGTLIIPAGVARAGGGCHEPRQTEKTVSEVVHSAEIAYKGACSTPNVFHVQAGQTVTWRNVDSFDHTVTSGSGFWESNTLTEGQTFSYKFTEAGLYPFYCMLHPNMGGVVDVRGATPVAATAPAQAKSASVPAQTSSAGLAGVFGVLGLVIGGGVGYRVRRNGSGGEQP